MIAVYAYASLALVFLAVSFFLFWHIPLLTVTAVHPANDICKDISVIIPAYNEEKNLERLLRSIKKQTGQPAEIIVVDDQSTDNTARVAQAYDVRLIRTEDRPEGWYGKNWPCWTGAQNAAGKRFLFIDADLVFKKEGLAAIAAAQIKRGGVVTVHPYHAIKRGYENLSAIFNAIVHAGMNAFTLRGSALKPAGAFGPCMLCTREDYFSIGGHEKVKHSVLEHMAMGHLLIHAGMEVNCFGGKNTVHFRMYPDGFFSLFNGWAKSFAVGAGYTSAWVMILINIWISGLFLAALAPIILPLVSSGSGLLWGILLYLLGASGCMWITRRIGNFPAFINLFFPLALVFFVMVFMKSAVSTWITKKASWKGKTVTFGK